MKYEDLPYLDQCRVLAVACDYHRAVAAREHAKWLGTEAMRTAARELRDRGLVYRDIGYLLGVSYQRVGQLLA